MANTTSYVRVINDKVDNPDDDTTYVFTPETNLKTFTLAGNSDGDTIAISGLSTDFKVRVVNNLLTLKGLKTGAQPGVVVRIQLDASNGGTDRLAFLDGSVDVSFTPNAPNSTKGDWTIGGQVIAKRYNFAKQIGNYTIDPSYTYSHASYEAQGALDGMSCLLTDNADDVTIQKENTYDLVRGIIDYRAEDDDHSTFSALDRITGNGHTMVEIGVRDTADGEDGHDADFVEMSGVDVLRIVEADKSANRLNLNASSYGDDISNIRYDGAGTGMFLDIEKLIVKGALDIDITNLDSCLHVSGTVDEVNFEVCTCVGGVSEVIVGVGDNGIETHLACDSSLYVGLSLSETKDVTGDLTVGDVAIASINVNIATSATEQNCLWHCASNACIGDASVGDITIGAFDITVDGDSGVFMQEITNCAYAICGTATAGDITIGNMNIDVAQSGSLYCFTVCNSACASASGDAIVGNITVGNIDMTLAKSAAATSNCFCQYASAGSGDSTSGHISIGDVTINLADDACAEFEIINEAYAYSLEHSATLGDIGIGDIEVIAEGDSCVCINMCNSASACSNVTVGDMTIGNVSYVAVSNSCLDIYAANCAYWASSGHAIAGNLEVGDINICMDGIGNSFSMCMEVYACDNECTSTVGDVHAGNVDVYGGADGYVYVAMDLCAYEGYLGNISLGSADICMESEGICSWASAYLDYDISAASIGDFTIGDIAMTGRSSAYMSVDWELYATCYNIGDTHIGNITMTMGQSGTACVSIEHSACHDMGNITIGDIVMNAEDYSACADGYLCFTAVDGSIGEINVGNVSVEAADSACAYFCAYFVAEDEIGNVSIGDINATAGKSACAYFSVEIYNENNDIGNINFGNIAVNAEGENAYACVWVSAENDDNSDIGTITFGNIDMTVIGDNATGCVSLSFTSSDTTGKVTVGDIAIHLDIDATKDENSLQAACADMCICTDSIVDLEVGDIAISAAEVTESFDNSADVSAHVHLYSCGDLIIGNVNVIGGYSNDGGQADDFDTLTSWLDTDSCGDTTIGNVDYSGYLSAANIDVSAMVGASIIKAAQDDTTITLNDSKNTVYLGAGDDIVYVTENKDLPKDAVHIDVINNFKAGTDQIDCDGLTGQFSWGGTTSNYASFISEAIIAFNDSNNYEVYAAKFGGSFYVAYNTGSDNTLDFVVKLVGSADSVGYLNADDVGL